MPILIVGFIAAAGYLAISGVEQRSIAVIDPNGFIKNSLKNTNQISFSFPKDVDTNNYKQKGFTDIFMLLNKEIKFLMDKLIVSVVEKSLFEMDFVSTIAILFVCKT